MFFFKLDSKILTLCACCHVIDRTSYPDSGYLARFIERFREILDDDETST